MSRPENPAPSRSNLDLLSSIAETPAQAALLATWIGRRQIAWLGRGADLARRDDPGLEDAVFLSVSGRLYSIQAIRMDDEDAGADISSPLARIRVLRWRRAAVRGEMPGGAVGGAHRIARRRRSMHCLIRLVEVIHEPMLLIEQIIPQPHRRRRARGRRREQGAEWQIGAYAYWDDAIARQPIVLAEDRGARTERSVTLVARVPDRARPRRMLLAGALDDWTVERIWRDATCVGSFQDCPLPASMFGPGVIDALLLELGNGPCEIRVDLPIPDPATPRAGEHTLVESRAAPIIGMILCDVKPISRSLRVVVDLGPDHESWIVPIETNAGPPDAGRLPEVPDAHA